MNRLVKFTYLLIIVWSFASMYSLLRVYEGTMSSIVGTLISVCVLFIEFIAIYLCVSYISLFAKSALIKCVLIWLIYTLGITILMSDDIWWDIRQVLWWPAIFIIFYVIGRTKNRMYEDLLLNKVFYIIFFGNLVLFSLIRSLTFMVSTNSGQEVFSSSNQIFYVVLLLPFTFLINNNRNKYFILIISAVATLLSFKRSAFIYVAVVLGVAAYYDFIKAKKISSFYKISSLCIIAIVMTFSFEYIEMLTDGHISGRIESLEEDKGSGRLDIFETVWNTYLNGDWTQILLGRGFDKVVKDRIVFEIDGYTALSAHNDYLEILYDFGLIGLAIYSFYLLKIFLLAFNVRKYDSHYYQAILSALLIIVIMSFVSHLVIYPTYYAYIIIIVAYVCGQLNSIKHERC